MAQSLIDFFAHIPGIGWIFRVCFLTISNALGFIISDPVKFLSYITAIPTLWTNRKKVKDVSRKIKRNFAKIKCWRRQSITKKIYFFSDINEESLQIALDITNYFKKFDKENIPLIIFYKGNENYDESKIDPDFLVYCEKKRGQNIFYKIADVFNFGGKGPLAYLYYLRTSLSKKKELFFIQVNHDVLKDVDYIKSSLEYASKYNDIWRVSRFIFLDETNTIQEHLNKITKKWGKCIRRKIPNIMVINSQKRCSEMIINDQVLINFVVEKSEETRYILFVGFSKESKEIFKTLIWCCDKEAKLHIKILVLGENVDVERDILIHECPELKSDFYDFEFKHVMFNTDSFFNSLIDIGDAKLYMIISNADKKKNKNIVDNELPRFYRENDDISKPIAVKVVLDEAQEDDCDGIKYDVIGEASVERDFFLGVHVNEVSSRLYNVVNRQRKYFYWQKKKSFINRDENLYTSMLYQSAAHFMKYIYQWKMNKSIDDNGLEKILHIRWKAYERSIGYSEMDFSCFEKRLKDKIQNAEIDQIKKKNAMLCPWNELKKIEYAKKKQMGKFRGMMNIYLDIIRNIEYINTISDKLYFGKRFKSV